MPLPVRTFFTVSFKGTPSARRAVWPRPGSCSGRGGTRGCVERSGECRAVGGRGCGESRRCGAAALPAASALGTHGAGRCRSAVTPHPSPAWPPAVTHSVAAPARAAGPSSRAGHPVAAKARSQGHGLRPRPSAFAPGRPWTASFPGKIGTCRADGGGAMQPDRRRVACRISIPGRVDEHRRVQSCCPSPLRPARGLPLQLALSHPCSGCPRSRAGGRHCYADRSTRPAYCCGPAGSIHDGLFREVCEE
jgi:hypothetical protein